METTNDKKLPKAAKDNISAIMRMDRNIVNYPVVFANNFGDDANLILDILGFISGRFKNNLFGYTSFSLSEFCKLYGHHKKNLMAPHPIFEHLTDILPKSKRGKIQPYVGSEGHVYKSVFDHCIYRMVKENVMFSVETASGVNLDNVKNVGIIGGNKALQLLREVKISNKATRFGQEEYTYEITLGVELFKNVSSNYFITMREAHFIELGRNKGGINRRGLFFYLMSEYSRCLSSKEPTRVSTPYFNMLVKSAMLKSKEPRYCKRTLINYLDIIGSKEILDFDHNLKTLAFGAKDLKVNIVFNNLEYLESAAQKKFFSEVIDKLYNCYGYITFPDTLETEEEGKVLEGFQLWMNAKTSVPYIAGIITDACLSSTNSAPPIDVVIKAIDENRWAYLYNWKK